MRHLRFLDRKERREMVRPELRQDAKITGELAVDCHSAVKRSEPRMSSSTVHLLPPPAYICGVSINLSGNAVISANRAFG